MLYGLVFLLVSACGPKAAEARTVQGDNPYAPQSGDGGLMAGDITVDSSSVYLAESQPPQVMVGFAYFQPTPCYQLRVEIGEPDLQNHISLRAYALAQKNKPCALMALATPLQANLNLGSFAHGHYFVELNGDLIGEFDS